jgi:hypothetical protein
MTFLFGATMTLSNGGDTYRKIVLDIILTICYILNCWLHFKLIAGEG